MSFGVSGLMSGLDTESIITQMMTVERRPILLLQQQEAAYQSKISAFGTLKGVLAELQTAAAALKETDLFAGFSASSANTTVLTASASDTAMAGTYQVTVDVLAQAQNRSSPAFAASTEVVGTGTLTIQVGTNDAVDVTIDGTNNTLAGIAQAINDSDADVTASVVNNGLGEYFLTLASKETGLSNTISLTMVDGDGDIDNDSGLSQLYYSAITPHTMTVTQAAANAELTVNGIDVQRAENTIDDLLEGVTLTLKTADAGNPFEVKVSRDVASVTSKIKSFIEKYNSALAALKTLQTSDPETKTVGPLQGDSTSRILQRRMQSLLSTEVEGIASSVNSLSELGVSADEDGVLSFDSAVFTTAYEENRAEVVNFFTQTTEGSEGFANQWDDFLDSYLSSTTGFLPAKEEGLNRSIEHIEDQVERIEFRLVKREENLRRQFESLELLLGQFQNTSGILSQQLDALGNLSAQIYQK